MPKMVAAASPKARAIIADAISCESGIKRTSNSDPIIYQKAPQPANAAFFRSNLSTIRVATGIFLPLFIKIIIADPKNKKKVININSKLLPK